MPARRRDQITEVIVHRIEVSQEDRSYGDTPAEVGRFFREHAIGVRATGGAMPYPILIAADGLVTQTVPLCRVTPHARSHNPQGIGIGLIGDFRRAPPSLLQRQQLVDVCVHLLLSLGLRSSALWGHDELVGGSHDPDKECPGRFLPMASLRQDVEKALTQAQARVQMPARERTEVLVSLPPQAQAKLQENVVQSPLLAFVWEHNDVSSIS